MRVTDLYGNVRTNNTGEPASFNDLSVITVANTSTVLVDTSLTRQYLMIQAPHDADIYVNLTGGTASLGGLGCLYLPAGSIYETKSLCPNANVTYFCASANKNILCIEYNSVTISTIPGLLDYSDPYSSASMVLGLL